MAQIAVVDIRNGRVEARDAKGAFVRTVGKPGAVNAAVQQGGIVVTYGNGRSELYDNMGNFKRTLSP